MHPAPAGQEGRICCAHQYLKWIYWAAAAGLAPWIVYLYLTQIPRALAHQLRILVFGIILVTILGVLVTAWMYSRRSPLTVMAATYTATTAFISVWFRILTRSGGSNLGESRPVFVVAAGVIVLLCVGVIAASRPSHRRAQARWLPIVLIAAALTLVPSLAIALTVRPDVRIEHHLQIAWTGLDMFELLAMAITGLALHRRSASVVIPATMTGALLLCDAWINIASVRGAARTQAIFFAFVEVPLAFLSLWIALQASSSQSWNT